MKAAVTGKSVQIYEYLSLPQNHSRKQMRRHQSTSILHHSVKATLLCFSPTTPFGAKLEYINCLVGFLEESQDLE